MEHTSRSTSDQSASALDFFSIADVAGKPVGAAMTTQFFGQMLESVLRTQIAYSVKYAGHLNHGGRSRDKEIGVQSSEAAVSALSLDKRLLFRIALFAAGLVGAFVLLKVSGVQRVNSWILLVGWLVVLSAACFFGKRRAP